MSDEDTIDPSVPPTDTGSDPAPAQQDTQVSPTPDAQNAETAPIAVPGTGPTPPLQSGNEVQNQEAQPPEQAWEKRYRDLQAYNDRRFAHMREETQRYQQEIQKFRQEQERAAQQRTVDPWRKESPKHQQFKSVLERSKAIEKQMQAVNQIQDPAAKEAAMQAIAAGVSDEEKVQLQQFREQQREFQSNFFSDPEGTMAPIMERIAQTVFSQMREQFVGRTQVDQDFSSPLMKPILENPQYAGYLQERLQRGVPYEDAMEMVKLRAAAEMMYQRQNGQDRSVVAAQEQQRLAKARASGVVAPDPASAPVDPYQMAMKEARSKGITPGTAQFNALILKYSNKPI